ncbi:MAG TPA: molybdopterin-dependent oxidoreductase [Acidimicrobiales bacterium]|nr:molybdopterin-dependent oxidoreductase [Acidimicrobiales bacterium]
MEDVVRNGPERPEDAEVSGAGVPIGRRTLFGLLGLGALGIAFGPAIQDRIASTFRPVADLLPSGGRFRIYSVVGFLPSRARPDYTLRVDGLVDTPFEISFDELAGMTPTSITRDFQCVTGWRVDDVMWRGVKLSELLDRAGVQSGSSALRFFSFDGEYTESLTLEQARRADVLVVYEMEGKPLSSAHGGPVRLFVAPMYGYKSLKWLDRIEATADVVPGYWEERGYDVDAWVGRSNGRDDAPTA